MEEELFGKEYKKRGQRHRGVAGGDYPWTQERELFQEENGVGGAEDIK